MGKVSSRKGIEYFRLMSPSVELWQVALKAESELVCYKWQKGLLIPSFNIIFKTLLFNYVGVSGF